VRLATVTKMKGGADGGELKFKLQLVSLNRVDEDGDQLFSCVIEETNEPVGRRDDAGKGANQRAILAEIDDVQGLTDQGPGFHDLVKGAVERTNGKTTAKTMRVAVKKMIAEGELVDTPRGILRA
jgi:hypothetical protein